MAGRLAPDCVEPTPVLGLMPIRDVVYPKPRIQKQEFEMARARDADSSAVD
jgi:hypothetical protein